jgi:putative transposase
MQSFGLSARKSCLLVGLNRAPLAYQPKTPDDGLLRKRLRELAGQRKRFGSPRLHNLLRREGLVVNHKRTERLYKEEGLMLRKKRRRKGAAMTRVTIPAPQRANQK